MSEYLLDDFMIPMGLTTREVSEGTGIPLDEMRALLADGRELTPELSEKLGEFFDVSSMLFYNIQEELEERASVRERRIESRRLMLRYYDFRFC